MKLKMMFRADGNSQIGAGHIMRCMSVGIAARNLGVDCCFVTADESFSEVLKNNGFRVIILDSDFSAMNSELEKLERIIAEEKPDIILTDSYYVTADYLERLRLYAKTAYIDDVMAFDYPVDMLINYNIYGSDADYVNLYRNSRLPRLVLGSRYAPLREEFQNGEIIRIKNRAENVLFSAGGADPERIALRFVEKVISDHRLQGLDFHIVMGSFEPDKDEITHIAETNDNIFAYSNVKRMSDLMRKCDVAVSAAGSTLYELCACGVPTITYVLADNQVPGAEAFAELGLMINAGDERVNSNLLDDIINTVYELSGDFPARGKMQKRAHEQIDGKGAERTVKAIIDGFGLLSR